MSLLTDLLSETY